VVSVQPHFAAATKAHPAFAVESLATLRAHLLANNVIVKNEEPLEGADRSYIDDPFGNRLEFLERINS